MGEKLDKGQWFPIRAEHQKSEKKKKKKKKKYRFLDPFPEP